MAERKVLKLADLIKEKMKYKLGEEARDVQLNIPRLSADIIIEVPARELCMDVFSMASDEEKAKDADNYFVYSIVKEPNLKDKELQQAYECLEPTDIVPVIFTPGEIKDITELAFKEAGFETGTVKVVDDLKN